MSIELEPPQDLTGRLAHRLRALRSERGFTLDALAAASGVSRSMISLVERGEAAATAVVLERLAGALGLTLAALFDVAPADAAASPGKRRKVASAAPGSPRRTAVASLSNSPDPVARRAEQPLWQDPASGYRRRNVSPAAVPQPFQIVEVHFPAGARVAFETGARASATPQQVWVLEGRIDVTSGDARHRLDEGDCLAMALDRPTMFHNPTRKPARYVVVLGRELPAGAPLRPGSTRR